MKNILLQTQVASPERAIWAFDPSEIELAPNENIIRQLEFYLGDSLEEVTPLYICGDNDIDPLAAKKVPKTILVKFPRKKCIRRKSSIRRRQKDQTGFKIFCSLQKIIELKQLF